MTLVIRISEEEVSSSTGKVLGDIDPSVTQDGLMTEYRDVDDEIVDLLDALKTIFDSHDHDPANPTGPGGPQIGADGEHSIDDGAVTEALIANGAITGGVTQENAISSNNIVDESIAIGQIGIPEIVSAPVNPGGTFTFTHGLNRPIQFCFFADAPEMQNAIISCDLNSVSLNNPTGGGTLNITLHHRGAGD